MKKILFQGDSITDYQREREEEMDFESLHDNNVFPPIRALGTGYVLLAAAQIQAEYPKQNLQIINRGIDGNRIADLLDRWDKDCLKLKPDYISILIGINDVYWPLVSNEDINVAKFYQIYKEILVWTQKELPQSLIILGQPFLFPGSLVEDYDIWLPKVQEIQMAIASLAQEHSLMLIPYQSIFDNAVSKTKADYWIYDGIHPSNAGNYLMAKSWLEMNKKSIFSLT